jgi:uncharacterized protein (DUF433 family)
MVDLDRPDDRKSGWRYIRSMPIHPRKAEIIADPDIMGGRPCLSGTRIPADIVLELLADGHSHCELMADFPALTEADISAVLRFAAARVAAE